MSACDNIHEHFDDWLDGRLTPDASRAIENHLLTCSACARQFESFRRLESDLALLGRAADALAAPVRKAKPRRNIAWFGPWRIAAAIVLAAGLTWVSQSGQLHNHPNGVNEPAATLPTVSPNVERPFAPSVRLVDDDARFAVPVESANPHIHVVWLYEATQATENPDLDRS